MLWNESELHDTYTIKNALLIVREYMDSGYSIAGNNLAQYMHYLTGYTGIHTTPKEYTSHNSDVGSPWISSGAIHG